MSYPRIDLEGATIAITGAARGIGLATAKAFVEHGAYVALGDLDEALAVQAAAEIGDHAIGHALDVTDKASYAAFLDATAQWRGPLDVLVNNAGGCHSYYMDANGRNSFSWPWSTGELTTRVSAFDPTDFTITHDVAVSA